MPGLPNDFTWGMPHAINVRAPEMIQDERGQQPEEFIERFTK
jgi:hypothetical protein